MKRPLCLALYTGRGGDDFKAQLLRRKLAAAESYAERLQVTLAERSGRREDVWS